MAKGAWYHWLCLKCGNKGLSYMFSPPEEVCRCGEKLYWRTVGEKTAREIESDLATKRMERSAFGVLGSLLGRRPTEREVRIYYRTWGMLGRKPTAREMKRLFELL